VKKMNLEVIRGIARKAMETRISHSGREPGYIFAHGKRTANLAGEIVSRMTGREEIIDEILYTGALFHDVGKGLPRHNEAGAVLVKQLLADVCDVGQLESISDIVRFHCLRKHDLDLNESILALQDADIIDHFGTQEVWLNFYNSAHYHHSTQHSLDWWQGERFAQIVTKMRTLLNFDFSKEIYDDRVAFHKDFLARFRAESKGLIYVCPSDAADRELG
jgi:uncharacterized protein